MDMLKDIWLRIKDWEETATRREKALVLIIVILLPLFLYYRFYFAPSIDKINRLKEEIKNLDAQINKYQKIASQHSSLEKILKERKAFLEEIKSILPNDKEIPGLLKNIAQTAKKSGLSVLSFKPGREIPKNYYSVIPLDMRFQGPYEGVINFLNQVEQMERLVVLNKIDFKPDTKTQTLIVSATFYTFKYTGKKKK